MDKEQIQVIEAFEGLKPGEKIIYVKGLEIKKNTSVNEINFEFEYKE